MLFILEEVKETILGFSQGTVKILSTRFGFLFGIKYEMTEYRSVSVKLSDFQLDKLKSAEKRIDWRNSKMIIRLDRY